MSSNTLVKTILESIKEEATSSEKGFVSTALSTLREFSTVCSNTLNMQQVEVQQSLLFASCAPTIECKEDELFYAFFIRDLFVDGKCYGMVNEDPLNALVLLGGAYQIINKRSSDDPTYYKLVEVGLDLLLLQATALFTIKEYPLAKLSLTTILEVAAGVDELGKKCSASTDKVNLDISIRAAPSAWMMACIFRRENDINGVSVSLNLADELYGNVLNKEDNLIIRQVHASALMGYSEVLTIMEQYVKAADVLDKAILVATIGLSKSTATAAQAYIASSAYHKRAEIYSLSSEWDRALECFQEAVSWCAVSTSRAPLNTFYEDRRTEYMNELGILYGIRGNLIEAQEVFLNTIKRRRVLAAQAEQHKSGLVAVLNNMSTLMSRYGNLDVAKEYLKESIDVVDAMTDSFFIADKQDLRQSLASTLQAIENTQKEQEYTLWRPIWKASQESPLPN